MPRAPDTGREGFEGRNFERLYPADVQGPPVARVDVARQRCGASVTCFNGQQNGGRCRHSKNQGGHGQKQARSGGIWSL